MGHQLLIEDKTPKITPMKSRVGAILKLNAPKTPKGCKHFCGMVNYLSIFLPKLQEHLIPIYYLTRKGIPFYWGEEQEKAFKAIKDCLVNLPVLVMPNQKGHFVLVSDTSKIACGSALYQEQQAYYSKKLPETVQKYSISELELTGIMANVAAFKHLLRNFTVYCDHSALVHIMAATREPSTLRLKKLIEHLSDYKFNIKFLKGKEMHISDFLSIHPDNDNGCPNEIIPIAFLINDVCNVVTRSMSKKAEAEVPSMYSLKGEHRWPEKAKEGIIDLTSKIGKQVKEVKEKSKGKEKIEKIELENKNKRSEKLDNNLIPLPIMRKDEFKVVGKLPLTLSNKYQMIKTKEPMERIDNYEGLLKPTPIKIELRGQLLLFDVDKELSFEIPRLIPTKKELEKENFKLMDHISDRNIFRKHIPKQAELDKFTKSMKEKVIHKYNIPITVKELRAEYNISPYFKDILTYITKGYCRYVGKAQRLFKLPYEDYIVMNGILFRIRYDRGNGGKPSLVLCVPEKYIPTILYQYHSPLLAGHPGTVKLYETLRR